MMRVPLTTSGPNKAWRASWMHSGPVTPSRAGRHGTDRKGRLPLTSSHDHPFSAPEFAADLDRREAEIEQGFARLETLLRELAPQQFDTGFAKRAVSALASIEIDADPEWFEASWTRPLDMDSVYARCALRLFARLVHTGSERNRHACEDGEPVDELIRRWGFHAVDITPCADGRLAGLLGAVLRVPLSIVSTRKSYAGAMFGVAEALDDWCRVELERCQRKEPLEEATRYLKVGVYHFSSIDPANQGCAAHGSDTCKAIDALLERLCQFKAAVEARYGAGDTIALLMIGLDTDTDAIRVHVPDANERLSPNRFVDAADLHALTSELTKPEAKDAVREAVAECAGVDAEDGATEPMRWFCGYLLKNNIAQVEAVLKKYHGPYPVSGHAERLIVIGDPLDDVQLRNLAFQAQMGSVEEGAEDLAVGVRILAKHAEHDVPILVLREYDPALPGDAREAAKAARRMRDAVVARQLNSQLTVGAAIRAENGGLIEFLEDRSAHDGLPEGAVA